MRKDIKTLFFDYAHCLKFLFAGDGRFDLGILDDDFSIVFEFKISNSRKEFKADSQKALQQIIEQQYVEGYENIKAYGISFFHKRCFISL